MVDQYVPPEYTHSHALFCTIYSPELLTIAFLSDEITAVRAAEDHIAECGKEHRPHMHLVAITNELRASLIPYHTGNCHPKEWEAAHAKVLAYLDDHPSLYNTDAADPRTVTAPPIPYRPDPAAILEEAS